MSRHLFHGELAVILAVCLAATGCDRQPAVQLASPTAQAVSTSSESNRNSPPASTAGELTISPESSSIAADDPGLQLLAGFRNSAKSPRTIQDHDASPDIVWKAEPPGIVRVEASGYVLPIGVGTATVIASSGKSEARATIQVEPRRQRSWNFGEDIMPILTRFGCNTGGCHGKAEGQNGFRLSFLGYDPEGDYNAVARDFGQRRISLLDPPASLLLTKAVGQAMHGGGPRLAAGSPEYQVLRDWIASGAPKLQGASHGALARLTIEPELAQLPGPGERQLRVMAEYADGHRRDVTRLAVYKTNDDSAASIDSNGRAVLLRRAETDLVVRYQSRVLTTRMTTEINPDLAFDFASLPRRNFIDEELFRRLSALKIPPSPPASDAAFLRRVSLDLTGEQPPPDQVRAFLAETAPDKRTKLVDHLLARQEFVLFWRIKLGDMLQITPTRQGNGAYRYQEWIDRRLAENTPWNEVVTQLLTALGDPNDTRTGGPVNYAMTAIVPTDQAEQTAQRFLGLRMRCAQCHDHPFDLWTQDDYFGLAAIFARVTANGMGDRGMMYDRPKVSINPKGEVLHLRTGKPAIPRPLGGEVIQTSAETDDPRQAFAAWLTASNNPYFARATVNWAWAQLFGKGIVDPADDMSRANPPVHPELLDALAKHFVESKYNLRELIRTIATSEAYGLSSATVPGNEHDQRFFSHHVPRPLTAHQMADALAQATDVPNVYGSLGPRLAIRVNDPNVPSVILDTFGRCSRAETCAPVQTPPLSLGQALLLIGGDTIESKVANLNGYLASALKLDLDPEELVESLYLRTVCRQPTAEELSHWSAELKGASNPSDAAEDLFWALLNSREFAFNH